MGGISAAIEYVKALRCAKVKLPDYLNPPSTSSEPLHQRLKSLRSLER